MGVVTQTMENYMANENDLQKDLSALRADIGALTETVGKLVSEAGKAQVAIRKTMKRGAKSAADLERLVPVRFFDARSFGTFLPLFA